MNVEKILYVFTSAPYSNSNGQEGIDAALIGAAFEKEISLLFVHDGVFQLKAGQNTQNSQLKQFSKAYGALADHGIEQIYVFDQSLNARGLTGEDMSIEAQMLNAAQITELIRSQYRVMTF